MTTEPGFRDATPRRILGRASVVGAGTAYRQGISFIAGLTVARVIGAPDFGVFSLARHLIDVTAILTRLGLQVGLQRYFGEARSGADPAVVCGVLRRVRLLAAAAAAVPVLGVTLGFGGVLEHHVYRHPGFANVLLVLALSLPFVTDVSVLGGAYRGTLRLAPSVLVESVLMPTVRLAVIVVLFLLGWRLWAVVTGTTVAALIASATLALRARTDFAAGDGWAHGTWREAVTVIRYSSVLGVSVLVTMLTQSLDLFVLGRYADAESLGQYSLVKTLLLLMGVFGIAFTQGLGALVADRYRRNDIANLVGVTSLTVRWVTLGTVPVYAIFLFWGSDLVAVFGESFRVPQSVVAWLATGQFLFSVCGPSGWALSMTGRERAELGMLILGLLVAGGVSWYAIPRFGQLGAALAACAAFAVANVGRLYCVRRHIGRMPFGVDVVAITASGVALAFATDVAVDGVLAASMTATATKTGVFLAAYAAAGWMWLLRRDEKRGAINAARSTANRLSSRAQHS